MSSVLAATARKPATLNIADGVHLRHAVATRMRTAETLREVAITCRQRTARRMVHRTPHHRTRHRRTPQQRITAATAANRTVEANITSSC